MKLTRDHGMDSPYPSLIVLLSDILCESLNTNKYMVHIYDEIDYAKKNIWISNNGELTAKEYSATEDHVFGAQTGHEWKLEKEDSLSKMTEVIRVTKRTDSKAIFITYSFAEVSAITPNLVLAQGGYAVMIPTRTAQVNMGAPGSR